MKLSFVADDKTKVDGVVVEKQIGKTNATAKAGFSTPTASTIDIKHEKKLNSSNKPKLKKKLFDEKKKSGWFKWWFVPIVILVGLLVAVGVYASKLLGTLDDMGVTVDIGSVGTIITDALGGEQYILKQDNGRTNFLLVGIDTRPNSGLMNTDTIMLISLEHETGQLSMVSIPRDTEAKYTIGEKDYTTKVNSAYARAMLKNGDVEGMNMLRSIVTEMTGQPVHYVALVNYYAFVDAVDQVGGLDVCVEREFSADYPKPGATVGSSVAGEEITVHFDEGCQFMDGERALIYARARKSNSVEGSDYARAARQQIVMKAFYDKFRGSSWFSQYDSALAFLDILGENVKMYDIAPEDLKAAWEVRDIVDIAGATNVVLSPAIDYYRLIKAGDDYRNSPTAGVGNWSEVNGYVTFLLENPGVFAEAPEIGVYDGGVGNSTANGVVSDLNNGYLLARDKGSVNMTGCTANQVGLVPGTDPMPASIQYLQTLYSAQLLTELPVTGKSVDIVLILCVKPTE